MKRHNFYDGEKLFAEFQRIRANEVNFNDLIETPMMLKLLPDLAGKDVLDIGCGMGQHAKQYSELGAKSVLGIDVSEKMLAIAESQFNGSNIEYRRLAIEDIEEIDQQFEVVTSSLVFDYIEDFEMLLRNIYKLMKDKSVLVFSMSHSVVTIYDTTIPRWTRDEDGNKLFANVYNYFIEGEKRFPWAEQEVVQYHKTLSTIINSIIKAGFILEEVQESLADAALRKKYPEEFAGTIHRPDFIFFKCRKRILKVDVME